MLALWYIYYGFDELRPKGDRPPAPEPKPVVKSPPEKPKDVKKVAPPPPEPVKTPAPPPQPARTPAPPSEPAKPAPIKPPTPPPPKKEPSPFDIPIVIQKPKTPEPAPAPSLEPPKPSLPRDISDEFKLPAMVADINRGNKEVLGKFMEAEREVYQSDSEEEGEDNEGWLEETQEVKGPAYLEELDEEEELEDDDMEIV